MSEAVKDAVRNFTQFVGIVEKVKAETGLPLYIGAPEA